MGAAPPPKDGVRRIMLSFRNQGGRQANQTKVGMNNELIMNCISNMCQIGFLLS